jgi:hypothetical protein
MEIPKNLSKEELFAFIVKNESRIIADKTATMKYADAFHFGCFPITTDGQVEKANKPVKEDITELRVKVIVNTTNVMDTHDDVHIPGLWKKSLKENKDIFFDQEHKHTFDSTIADYEDLKVYTENFTWKELGQKWEGETEALVFEATITEDRNPFMFKQYKSGRVRNHSVGMRYVKMATCINDKSFPQQYANWNKYISEVANADQVKEQGYFFAQLESKAIEGSAVKQGSNWVTPTLDNNMKSEPEQSTPEPPQGTHKLTSDEIIKIINNF